MLNFLTSWKDAVWELHFYCCGALTFVDMTWVCNELLIYSFVLCVANYLMHQCNVYAQKQEHGSISCSENCRGSSKYSLKTYVMTSTFDV